jgi:SAM-dependent methyltransferase
VLHIRPDPAATIVGDLAAPDTLPSGQFDCIILTQTLQYVFELPAAIRNIRRSLRPGGVALITLPGIAPLCADEWAESHYWFFTCASVERLLSAEFDRDKLSVTPHGNLYAASAFLHGAAVEEVSKKRLRRVMPEYPIVITARAVA